LMSAIQANTIALQRHIARLLTRDEARRRHLPAITLSRQPAPPEPPSSPPVAAARKMRAQFHYIDDREVHRMEAEPSDIFGTWPRDKILRMDAAFVRRVERAFRSGGENRRAAAATHGAISTRPR